MLNIPSKQHALFVTFMLFSSLFRPFLLTPGRDSPSLRPVSVKTVKTDENRHFLLSPEVYLKQRLLEGPAARPMAA